MSKFDTVLESNLNKTNLLRVRVKHDPRNEAETRGDYVGYVLEEDGEGNIVAIVPGLGADRMNFGLDQYEVDSGGCGMQEDPLIDLKKHIVDYLMVRGYHDKVSESMEIIIKSTNVIELEQVIGSCGCDSSEILNVYRDYFGG